MVAQTEILETPRLDSESESDFRKRFKLMTELGPEIVHALMKDRTAEDLVVNPDGRVWIMRQGKPFEVLTEISPLRAVGATMSIAEGFGLVATHNSPVVSGNVPYLNCRVEALVAPVVPIGTASLSFRKKGEKKPSLYDYAASGILTNKDDPLNGLQSIDPFEQALRSANNHVDVLFTAIEHHKNILVVGGTGSGKTTLLDALNQGIAERTPHDRVLILEDLPELRVAIENYVQLTACKAVPMDDLIRSCLRMKPHRILVGEVRGTEALTAMEAWNTGHPGGSMTIHANNAMEGLNRIVFLCQKTANPFPTHILARIVAETIHLVVYIEAGRQFPCGRKVKEVCLVKGHDGERFEIEQL
jgi:type IV secretion system protein VirB11